VSYFLSLIRLTTINSDSVKVKAIACLLRTLFRLVSDLLSAFVRLAASAVLKDKAIFNAISIRLRLILDVLETTFLTIGINVILKGLLTRKTTLS
jgi:hypothetical protein